MLLASSLDWTSNFQVIVSLETKGTNAYNRYAMCPAEKKYFSPDASGEDNVSAAAAKWLTLPPVATLAEHIYKSTGQTFNITTHQNDSC